MWVTGVGLAPLMVLTIAVVLPYRNSRKERRPTAATSQNSLWYWT
jgi:hypothetical protein